MTEDTTSKDYFFAQLARISDEMIAAHGKEFTMGALVLAARFIAEKDARAARASGGADAPDGNVSPAAPH
jgi:hypothetical protein